MMFLVVSLVGPSLFQVAPPAVTPPHATIAQQAQPQPTPPTPPQAQPDPCRERCGGVYASCIHSCGARGEDCANLCRQRRGARHTACTTPPPAPPAPAH